MVWTRPAIIARIKAAKRRGAALNWSAAMAGETELRRAARAARRVFGSWARALTAAGLDADFEAARRRWTASEVVFELRERHAAAESLAAGDVLAEDCGLYFAARRHAGGLTEALRRARLKPQARRRRWDRRSVLAALRKEMLRGGRLSAAALRRRDPGLHAAAVRRFGSWRAAIVAARSAARKSR